MVLLINIEGRWIATGGIRAGTTDRFFFYKQWWLVFQFMMKRRHGRIIKDVIGAQRRRVKAGRVKGHSRNICPMTDALNVSIGWFRGVDQVTDVCCVPSPCSPLPSASVAFQRLIPALDQHRLKFITVALWLVIYYWIEDGVGRTEAHCPFQHRRFLWFI